MVCIVGTRVKKVKVLFWRVQNNNMRVVQNVNLVYTLTRSTTGTQIQTRLMVFFIGCTGIWSLKLQERTGKKIVYQSSKFLFPCVNSAVIWGLRQGQKEVSLDGTALVDLWRWPNFPFLFGSNDPGVRFQNQIASYQTIIVLYHEIKYINTNSRNT